MHEKLDQAVEILREQEIDLWLTFVRETSLTNDPSLDLIAGVYSAWQGAFLVSASGERVAIVGRFDAPSVEQTGAYDVIAYDESIRPALREAVERLAPRSIALNYSESDPAADGLTHGLWRVLQDTFAGTPYPDRFVSSEAIVNALRGRKSAEEVDRIRGATRETEEIFDVVTGLLRPGHERARDRFTHARGGRETGSRLRVGARPLPGGQRRTGEGCRPQPAGRSANEAR